ncbi:MAG: polysaccharide biosynthesis protein [Patescibacteria group bacterium]|nr:polysaccharide biosynthesis protein [Patescibacteria group bacterium]
MNNILQKFIQRASIKRTLFFITADIILITVSVLLAFLLRFDGVVPTIYLDGVFQWTLATSLGVVLPMLYFFGLHSISWVYVSTKEVFSLLKAVTLSFIIIAVTIFLFRDNTFVEFPRSVLLMSYMLVFITTGGLRLTKRVYLQNISSIGDKCRRVLIVGAGDAGEQLVRSIISGQGKYHPECFVDDKDSKKGEIIHGVKVVGKIDDIPKVVLFHNIEEIIIALPSAGSDVIKKAVDLGRQAGIQDIKIIPSLNEIIGGKISMSSVREVRVKDLLQRESVARDTELIESFIKGKIVLVTGAAGSIGSEIARQTASFQPSLLVLIDQDETGIFHISGELKRVYPNVKLESVVGDIGDEIKIDKLFAKIKPNIVFHAAAYKHVPLMELDALEAVKNNIGGTKVVAESALKYNVDNFVFISTDKAVNPTSVMGATKRVGEMICEVLNQKNQTKFCSVRFGNVLDSRGNVVSIFEEQIKRGGPVVVTHPDMQRYFMTTPEACLLVMQAGAMEKGGEVFVLDMGEPIKILDLAKNMIKLSGFESDKDIPIVFTGLRPGEKLFEEILTAEEGTIKTQNQKIFVAQLTSINPSILEKVLVELMRISDPSIIIRILKKLIPTYTSKLDE